MGDTEIRIYICNSDSKNRMSLLVSKAQEGVLSGVELRRDCVCLRESKEERKKKWGKKRQVQAQFVLRSAA